MTNPDDVRIENDGAVLRLTFTAPDRLNSITTAMFDAMSDAVEAASGPDAATRVAVVSGEGRAFCSGAVMSPDAVDGTILESAARFIRAVTGAPFPVIAGLNGLAAGIGSSIALACDFQVAKEDDFFLQAFVNVGLMGDGAAHELLAASIGRARAMRLLMLGERLSNADAHAAGLITHCVAADEWQQTLDDLVEKLTTGPTRAYAKIKSTINAASLANLDETLRRETEGQTELGQSSDFIEGATAFVEKRPARFTGA